MRLVFFWFCFVLATAVMPAAGADSVAQSELPKSVREAFAWYETLGYPKLGKAEWIGVLPAVRSGWTRDSSPPVAGRGFLLSDDGKHFTVLYPDLQQRICARKMVYLSPPRTRARVGWQYASFEDDARAVLLVGRRIAGQTDPSPGTDYARGLGEALGWDYFDHRAPLRPVLFVIGHACYERGLMGLAKELCETADLLPDPGGRDTHDGSDLRTKMQHDLGYWTIWRAVKAVGGTEFGEPWFSDETKPLQSREQLLQRFRRFPELYPGSEHVARAKEIAAMLETMVAEDETHVPLSDKQMEKLTVEAQVRELIWRLRDQNGHQWTAPNDCDVFDDYFYEKMPNEIPDSPAHRLAIIGIPAVPQLIDALDDKHLTRTVACWRRYTFSHQILTVGECIEAILSRIAGRRFEEPNAPPQERAARVRKMIEAWWQRAQTLATDGDVWTLAEDSLGRDLLLTGSLQNMAKDNGLKKVKGFTGTIQRLLGVLDIPRADPVEVIGVNSFYVGRFRISPGFELVVKGTVHDFRFHTYIFKEVFVAPHRDEEFRLKFSDPRRWGEISYP